MTDLKTGILPWTQGRDDAGTDRGGPREVERLGYDGVWTWDHIHAIFGDPRQPIFEGWTLAVGLAMATKRVRWAAGRCQHVPQPGPGREDGRRRSTISAPAGPSWASAVPGSISSTRPTASTSGRASASGSTGWMRRSARARGARRRHGHLRAGRPLRVPRAAPPAGAGPAAPAHHDRRLGREEDAPDHRQVRRHVERHGPPRRHAPQVEVLQGHCDAVGRDISEIEFTLGAKPSATRRPRPSGLEAAWSTTGRRWRMSRMTHFWNGTPEQIAERLRPTSSWASGRSSPSSRRRTTPRRWSASSGGQASRRREVTTSPGPTSRRRAAAGGRPRRDDRLLADARPPTPRAPPGQASRRRRRPQRSAAAALTVTASGSVRCGQYACQASIWFEPVGDRKATISPDWFGHASHQFHLSTETARDGSVKVGKILKPPATLDPGTYLVVAATEILSDIASEAPGPTKVFPVIGTSLECSAPVTVGPATTRVRVKVACQPDDVLPHHRDGRLTRDGAATRRPDDPRRLKGSRR